MQVWIMLKSVVRVENITEIISQIHTTLRVPTRTSDGVLLFWTISEMKLAAIPIMAINDTACMILTILNVPPIAP